MWEAFYVLYTLEMPLNTVSLTFTFADDTAIVGIHSCPLEASKHLLLLIDELEIWHGKWRIKENSEKCAFVTFTFRKPDCNPVKIYNVQITQNNHVKYLGTYFNRRLT